MHSKVTEPYIKNIFFKSPCCYEWYIYSRFSLAAQLSKTINFGWLVGCLAVQLSKTINFGWLVGCFGFNGPLRQYFGLYRAVSQREGEREEKG